MIYSILDKFFVVFHTALILFNVFGWIWAKTRRANLITLSLTGASWFVLGIFYGWGYCPLTDWHFTILEKLQRENLPQSYIQYLAERLSGLKLNAELVDDATLYIFLFCFFLSLFLNFKNSWRRISKE